MGFQGRSENVAGEDLDLNAVRTTEDPRLIGEYFCAVVTRSKGRSREPRNRLPERCPEYTFRGPFSQAQTSPIRAAFRHFKALPASRSRAPTGRRLAGLDEDSNFSLRQRA